MQPAAQELAAVICAAGAGSRMGKTKALCTIGLETFLSSIVHCLKRAGINDIVCVLGADADSIMASHKDLELSWCQNSQWQTTHMRESLYLGLRTLPKHCSVLHWPVDCIGVSDEDLKRLIDTDADLIIPRYQGQPGHPIRLSAYAAQRYRQSYMDFDTLRDFVASFEPCFVEATGAALMNCNDPKMLEHFLAQRLK